MSYYLFLTKVPGVYYSAKILVTLLIVHASSQILTSKIINKMIIIKASRF